MDVHIFWIIRRLLRRLSPQSIASHSCQRDSGIFRESESGDLNIICSQLRRSAAGQHKHGNDRFLIPLLSQLADRSYDCLRCIFRFDQQRRNKDHNEGINAGILRYGKDRSLIVFGSSGSNHIDGVEQTCFRGQKGTELLPNGFSKLWHCQPFRLARIGTEDRGTTAIGNNRHPIASGQWLMEQNSGSIEHLFQRIGANHPRLMKEGIDGCIRRFQQRTGVRRRCPASGRRTSTFDSKNGFGARNASGNAREFSRIAERFQIEQDYIGPWIAFPVLEQIIAGNIRFVAHGNE